MDSEAKDLTACLSGERLDLCCAIAAFPEAYVAVDDMKFGRRSAGAGFLEALCRYVDKDGYALAVASEADLHPIHFAMAQFRDSLPTANTVALSDQTALARFGTLYSPGPILTNHAWARRTRSDDAYSIVGVNHTVATLQATPSLCRYLLDPLQPWDALICTSQSVKSAIETLFESYLSYLNSRGIRAPRPPVQLPVIPLGVHCDHFDATDERQAAARSFRKARGIGEDDVVLLSLGRIDPATKAHPVPLFLSVERAQREMVGDPKLHLAMVGTFLPAKAAEQEIVAAARRYAPSVDVHWVDGKDAVLCQASWQTADIFLSLSDNIQESFGLTPIEAMAASLPSIVSDWNGYKETVVHGETGLRIPTGFPDASFGLGAELSNRYCGNQISEAGYLHGVAQLTYVDVRKCGAAIVALARNHALRHEMSQKCRARAVQQYAWKVVLAQYREAFDELAAIRNSKSKPTVRSGLAEALRPDHGDPLKMFGGYPTSTLSLTTRLSITRSDARELLDSLLRQPMCGYPQCTRADPDDLKYLVDVLMGGEVNIQDLSERFPRLSRAELLSACVWLMKYDVVEAMPVSDDPEADAISFEDFPWPSA